MTSSMSAKPTPEHLIDVHRRLLDNDAAAPAELAELVIEPLALELMRGPKRPRDEAFAVDAATDAVLECAKDPRSFDPSRLPLWSFLRMAARRDLANRILKERRHAGLVRRYADVALPASARNKPTDPMDGLVEAELARKQLEGLTLGPMKSLADPDLAVLRLVAEGVRDTARFAAVMGLNDQPVQEQRRLVKQAKDRILKRLKRHAAGDPNE